MKRIHPAGVYEAICPMIDPSRRDSYMLRTTDNRGQQTAENDNCNFVHGRHANGDATYALMNWAHCFLCPLYRIASGSERQLRIFG